MKTAQNMTKSRINQSVTYVDTLPFGDGSNKIFGMENFGNTCYCNSILQCLYYSEKFRTQLVKHKITKHDPKLVLAGVKSHNFTMKYEQLVAKRIKEGGKISDSNNGTDINGNGSNNTGQANENNVDRPKSSRKGSIFGIKFNSLNGNNSNSNAANTGASDENSNYNQLKKSFLFESKNCEALSSQQRILIQKNPDFQNLQIMVTRPTVATSNSPTRNDYSQSSSTLLNNDLSTSNPPTPVKKDETNGPITSQSCFVVVGIPQPESFLAVPINPFNPSPSIDQRKRSALINGPIINLDHSLQLPSQQTDESALLYALKDVFESMVENKSQIGVVSPTHFITKLKEKNFLFRQNNMHHDAHEFCNYLINETIECLNLELGPENNWCTNLFQGLITNETKCLSCETISSKEETFLDLSIDIPPGDSSYSLTYSLNNFSKLETLTHQNKFYCNTCSSLQEATKTIKLKKLPEILVINFKRFKYDETADKMVKLFDSISYPFKLRLFNTTDSKSDDIHQQSTTASDENDNFTLYELYALVVHIGGGPMHGHYISLAKCKAGLWLLFDDETVEIVDDAYVMRFFGNGPGLASAYILFYQECKTVNSETGIDFGMDLSSIYNGSDYSLVEHSNNGNVDDLNASIHSNRKNSSIASSKLNSHAEHDGLEDTLNSNSNVSNPFLHKLSDSSSVDTASVKEFIPTLADSTLDNNGASNGPNAAIPSVTTTPAPAVSAAPAPSNPTSNLMRKTSVFKKNFKFESSAKEPEKEKEKSDSSFHLPRSLSRSSSIRTSSINSLTTTPATDSSIPEVSDGEEAGKPEKKTWVGGLKRRESRLGSFSSVSSSNTERKQSVASIATNSSSEAKEGKKRGLFGFKRKN